MKKLLALMLLFQILGIKLLKSQNPSSFYIDTVMQWTNPLFVTDKIYFRSLGGDLFATDYSGNIQWSLQMSTPISCMTAGVNCLFVTAGQKVFKVDSTGTVVWVKDFSAKINSASVDENVIGDILFDGEKIYLNIIQAPAVQQFSPDVYPSVVTLDTAGSVLNVITDYVQPSVSFNLQPGIASLTGGAWLGFVQAPGFTHLSFLKRITSAGYYDLAAYVPAFFLATTTDIRICITLIDSTYLIATNSNYMGGGHFELSKINENGNVIWQKVYSDTLFTCGTAGTQISGVASDSSGFIYVMGTAGEDPCIGIGYFGAFCMKLDSVGNVLFTKLWNHSSISLNNGTQCLHYRNGKLFCSIVYQGSKPGMLMMDSLFAGSCNDPDSIITLHGSTRVGVTNPLIPSGSTLVYVPSSDTVTNFSSVLSRADLCVSLNLPPDFTSNNFILYPNPTTGKLKIEKEELRIGFIRLYNLFGKEIMSLHSSDEIDLSPFPSGMYVVEISGEDFLWRGKVLKTD